MPMINTKGLIYKVTNTDLSMQQNNKDIFSSRTFQTVATIETITCYAT